MTGHESPAPRVRLRELEEGGPELQPVPLERSGRYQVLGQIAQGGVGQILRGRDLELNRDVALKLLRDCHVGDPELVRRFIEEAQIGGQLQHPGIVPVFELGLQADDRPFFAMKLVKGRTLSALLSQRRDPSDQLRRFLSIFAQACHTMAYAHSRGVIHRDLKPSNVMVGAFGEMQIVDWGFAKVLGQGGVVDERRAKLEQTGMTRIATVRSMGEGSDSLPGSVMGTPAYMPPEQALGHIEDLDERSDVFSLGAVLCEILTGKPPYVGGRDDLLVLAAQGRVEDAFARLDACGADPALASLAKACLAPLRKDRPAEAGELAAVVAGHLAAAEDREQRAKLAALEARRQAAAARAGGAEHRAEAEAARADREKQSAVAERARARAERAQAEIEEAQRQRRRILALAAAVLVALLAGGGGYAVVSAKSRQYERETSATVRQALEEAQLLGGMERWSEAVTAAERAVSLAGDATDTMREQAESTLAALQQSSRAADAAAEADERNRRLVAQLEETRFRHALERDGTKVDAELTALFRASGIDVTVPAALARFDGIAAELAIAIDDWAMLRGRRDLLPVASRLDPDPVRTQIRDAPGREAVARLAAVADRPEVHARTLDLLGLAFMSAGDFEGAVDLLDRAHMRHAADPWINLHLAQALNGLPLPRTADARRFLAAALAQRPGSAQLRRALEEAEGSSSDLDRLRETVRFLDPRYWERVEVNKSVATGTRRRIYFNKQAVTNALLSHKGGEEWTAAPMEYEHRTAFVAENLDESGAVVGTDVLLVRYLAPPEFRHYDGSGRQQDLPRDCRGCHLGTAYYYPMQAFPAEPGPRRVEIGERGRDQRIVVHFLEAFHRGGRVFGPYGAIWFSKLKADARDGTLAPDDRTAWKLLEEKYAELAADR